MPDWGWQADRFVPSMELVDVTHWMDIDPPPVSKAERDDLERHRQLHILHDNEIAGELAAEDLGDE